MTRSIPFDIEQFILQHIDSIAEWEGLLLLRAHKNEKWDAKRISERLYINQSEAEKLLATLATKSYVISENGSPPSYQYQPESTEIAHILDRAAAHYVKSVVPITHLIHSKAKTRMQEFADAFKIRKD